MHTERIKELNLRNDIDLIESVGVKLHYNKNIDEKLFEELKNEYHFIYIAVGAKKSKKLKIDGEYLPGVYDQLSFLFKVRSGQNTLLAHLEEILKRRL